MKQIPYIAQSKITECGIACVASLLQYYDHYITKDDLHEHINVAAGANVFQLHNVLQLYKLNSSPIQYDSVTSLDLPAILHWQGMHFVVLEKIEGDWVHIVDPAVGKYKLPIEKVNGFHTPTKIAIEVSKSKEFITKKRPDDLLSLKHYFGYFKAFEGSVIFAIWLALAVKLLTTVFPFFSQFVIDKVLDEQNLQIMPYLVMVYIGAISTSGILSLIYQHFVVMMTIRVLKLMGKRIINQLLHKNLDFFIGKPQSYPISRVSENDQTLGVVLSFLIGIAPSILAAVLSLGIILYFSWILASVIIIAGVVYSSISYYSGVVLKKKNHALLESQMDEHTKILDISGNIKSVKSFVLENIMGHRYREARKEKLNKSAEMQRINIYVSEFFRLAPSVLNLINFLFIVYIINNPDYVNITGIFGQSALSFGVIFSIVAFQGIFFSAISDIFKLIIALKQIEANIERMEEVASVKDLDSQDFQTEAIQNYKSEFFEQKFSIDNLAFKWHQEDEENLIENISLSAKYGDKISIMGRSGQGKSTLCELISRLRPHDCISAVNIGDVSASDIPLHIYRKHIAYVTSTPVFFSANVKDNVTCFNDDISIEDIMAVLDKLELTPVINKLHGNLDTQLGQFNHIMSDGEKQRLILARIILAKPKILILDEPTSFLDDVTKEILLREILAMECTVICISHDRAIAQKFKRHYHLKNKTLHRGLATEE